MPKKPVMKQPINNVRKSTGVEFRSDKLSRQQAVQSARGEYGKESERQTLKQMSKMTVVQSHMDLHKKPFWEISNEHERAYIAIGGSSVEEDDEDLLRDLNRNIDQDQSNILLQYDESLDQLETEKEERPQIARRLILNNSADQEDPILIGGGDEVQFLSELLHQRLMDQETEDFLRGGFTNPQAENKHEEITIEVQQKQRGANTLDCRISNKQM